MHNLLPPEIPIVGFFNKLITFFKFIPEKPKVSSTLDPDLDELDAIKAHQFIDSLGITPQYFRYRGTALAAFTSHMENVHHLSLDAISGLFHLIQTHEGIWVCKIVLDGEVLAENMHPAQSIAKETAAKLALIAMQSHEKYYKNFLILIKSNNPVSELLDTIRVYGNYTEDAVKLEATKKQYKVYRNNEEYSEWSYQLSFKNNKLGFCKGSWPRIAREGAAKKTLAKLRRALDLLTLESVISLSMKFDQRFGIEAESESIYTKQSELTFFSMEDEKSLPRRNDKEGEVKFDGIKTEFPAKCFYKRVKI